MGDYIECTNALGYIYAALDKIYEHSIKAANLAYSLRSYGYVRRVDCTDLTVDLLRALENAKMYADQIERIQDAVEDIDGAIETENREELEAAKAERNKEE